MLAIWRLVRASWSVQRAHNLGEFHHRIVAGPEAAVSSDVRWKPKLKVGVEALDHRRFAETFFEVAVLISRRAR